MLPEYQCLMYYACNFLSEMCLTSNLKAKTVESYDVHHLGYWYFKKHPLIICVSTCITEILCCQISGIVGGGGGGGAQFACAFHARSPAPPYLKPLRIYIYIYTV